MFRKGVKHIQLLLKGSEFPSDTKSSSRIAHLAQEAGWGGGAARRAPRTLWDLRARRAARGEKVRL